MKTYNFHNTIHQTTVAFLDLFNDLIVKRYDGVQAIGQNEIDDILNDLP